MKTTVLALLLIAIIWWTYQSRRSDETRDEYPASVVPQQHDTASPGETRPSLITATTPAISPNSATLSSAATLPSAETLSAIVTISGQHGSGTGFICNFRGKAYVITNQHVLAAGNQLTIRTAAGFPLVARQIFAATDADIALIQCVSIPPGTTSLEIAIPTDKAIQRDDPVVVPGNSKGDGVITQTPGKLLAVGPQRIEVDNPVYPGNSGSPIIHVPSTKVIGVLTEAELVSLNEFEKASFRSQNSAIKSEVRYFGHRIDSVQKWEVLDWNTFQQTEALIQQSRGELNAIIAYFTDSSQGYKNFKELHVARNAAAKVYYDHNCSNADKTAAYNRFLRDIDAFARRAKARLDGRKIYLSQQNNVEIIDKMSNLISGGTAIAKRDRDLVATLLDRGN